MSNKLTVTYGSKTIIDKEITGNPTVTYDNKIIATVFENQTKTLKTANKLASTNIVINPGGTLKTAGKILNNNIDIKLASLSIPAPYYIISDGDYDYCYSNVLEPTENDWIYVELNDISIYDQFTEIACIRDAYNPSDWTYIAFGDYHDYSVYYSGRNVYKWDQDTKQFEYFWEANTNPTFVHSPDGSIIGFSYMWGGMMESYAYIYINNEWSEMYGGITYIVKDCSYDKDINNFYNLGIDPMTTSGNSIAIMVNGDYVCNIELNGDIDARDSLSWIYDGNFDKFSYWSYNTGEVFICDIYGNILSDTVINVFYNWPALDIRNNRDFVNNGYQGFSALVWWGELIYGGLVYDPDYKYFDIFRWDEGMFAFDKVEWSFYSDDGYNSGRIFHNEELVADVPENYVPFLLATHLDDN